MNMQGWGVNPSTSVELCAIWTALYQYEGSPSPRITKNQPRGAAVYLGSKQGTERTINSDVPAWVIIIDDKI